MSVMACGKMGDVIGFRPSKKADEAINLLVKSKKAKSKSDAVNQLIEKGLSSQSEQLEDVTGLIIPCPMREAQVDTSVCQTCHKHPCDTWGHIKSWARVSPKTAVTTP